MEMQISAEQVIMLTRPIHHQLLRHDVLTDLARQIISSQAIHIASQYVFWHEVHGKPMPLFGLEFLVSDVFSVTWTEMLEIYSELIWIDEQEEARHFFSHFPDSIRSILSQ